MDRIDLAKKKHLPKILAILQQLGIYNDQLEIQFLGIKSQQLLQLWVRKTGDTSFQLYQKFPLTAFSGTLGPKEKEGDLQIPEGNYFINRFNPKSKYHLSLGINYPNEEDLFLGRTGSDIFIHGGSTSKGCLAIGDEAIEIVYLLALMAKDNGQKEIPVQIVP